MENANKCLVSSERICTLWSRSLGYIWRTATEAVTDKPELVEIELFAKR